MYTSSMFVSQTIYYSTLKVDIILMYRVLIINEDLAFVTAKVSVSKINR